MTNLTLPWNEIETVLLDMDGTLLDLYFDNHFWQDYIPRSYAQKHGISLEAAIEHLVPRFRAAEGTLDWYCIDHWSRELDMDVVMLKKEVAHLIAVHPYVPEFLERLRQHGKRVVMVTNAHHKSLNLKMERTKLAGHFDRVISSHEFGAPKEEQVFWQKLQQHEPFKPHHTLLIDDTLSILRSARKYGIGHLLAVYQPDTRAEVRNTEEFAAVRSFKDIMPS